MREMERGRKMGGTDADADEDDDYDFDLREK